MMWIVPTEHGSLGPMGGDAVKPTIPANMWGFYPRRSMLRS